MRVWRIGLVVLIAACGCGARAKSDGSPAPEPSAEAGSDGGVVFFDDAPIQGWQWSIAERGAETTYDMAAQGEPLHLAFDHPSQHVDISTHQHFDLTQAERIEFVARANRSATLMVSATPILSRDFWTELENGEPWQIATVALDTEPERLAVAFSELGPAGPGTPRPLTGDVSNPGTMVHFLVEDASDLELWFDEIWLRQD